MFQTHSMVPRRCFPNLMNISRSVSETRCISQSDQNKTWSWPSKVDILFSNKLIRLWCQPFYLVPEFKRSDWWKWRTPAPMKMTLYGPLIAISFNNFVTGVRACILPSLFVFSKKSTWHWAEKLRSSLVEHFTHLPGSMLGFRLELADILSLLVGDSVDMGVIEEPKIPAPTEGRRVDWGELGMLLIRDGLVDQNRAMDQECRIRISKLNWESAVSFSTTIISHPIESHVS